ncbi:LacI family DNA-binding transcriptional regulator [Leifsonia shinshuensis]|uniref:LacI family transcriptional regulator n=1 Tax=Leifsonia shinshuensis TaxID=150026 RepID=A0A853CX85_9MICO|nr:LacI family DNA-binding transcriptional regulator [Leifsonia shinshuensis]NYJ25726.1 LacI family transcriptional regulator [Leifsonia shinshuensis]
MAVNDNRPAKRVTMKDVAKRAGVSQPTVSFVLNDRRDISVAPETRERILRAAKELRFQPNRAAQSLRSNRPFTIGVIADRVVSQPYAGQIVLGVQQAVQPAGYVSFVVEISETPDNGKAAVENLVRQGVAGLVYAAPGPEPVQAVDVGEDIRTIFVNCWPANVPDAALVLADEYQGGRDVAAATFAAGHRDVVFLGGPASDYACQERERGLVDAAAAAGIDPASIRREYGTYHVSSGYDLASRILQDGSPTALVCGNDRMAVGALLASHAAGLECPRDISIVGFDDQPELAAELHPPLATVALPHLQMGMTAGSLLIADDEPTGRTLVPCRYIDRASLAAPRTASSR